MNKKQMFLQFFQISRCSTRASIALLVLRLVAGAAFIVHGFPKIQQAFTWMGADSTMPGFLQFLGALSEFGGGIAWILGLATALASLGLLFTMATAVSMLIITMQAPFISMIGSPSYELALVYLSIALILLLVGPGKYSLDKYIFGEAKK